ncbi:hypothetical protein WJX81_003543 [Elliptochloris bilobata]|uniref:Signal recognition particle receptor subunit beta n=1 Tax=Elliptochloris bilobata TaxID=381761 RepID=A0AAW1S7B5_9CHLO
MTESESPFSIERLAHSPDALKVFIALLLLLCLLGVLQFWTQRKKGDSVLLVGACGAGKTTLFLQLRDGTVHQGTVASMVENVDAVQLPAEKSGKKCSVRMVDVPGHPRVRSRFEQYADRACGIIFVVDAVDFLPHKTEIAEQLYEVLTNAAVFKRRLPLLLACNKADQGARAHTVDFLRRRLEREVEALRGTRDTLGGEAGGQRGSFALARPGQAFSFDAQARGGGPRVSAGALSALTGDVTSVTEFVRACAGT